MHSQFHTKRIFWELLFLRSNDKRVVPPVAHGCWRDQLNLEVTSRSVNGQLNLHWLSKPTSKILAVTQRFIVPIYNKPWTGAERLGSQDSLGRQCVVCVWLRLPLPVPRNPTILPDASPAKSQNWHWSRSTSIFDMERGHPFMSFLDLRRCVFVVWLVRSRLVSTQKFLNYFNAHPRNDLSVWS